MNTSVPYAVDPIDGLVGVPLPNVELNSTDDISVRLPDLDGVVVIFIYPRTSPPDGPIIQGWDQVLGAKGCTPQSCAFRDLHSALRDAGADNLFGMSVQDPEYQKEVVSRLALPFPLLSDEFFAFQKALDLPTFEAAGMALLHRITLVARDGKIERTFHSIDDPAMNAKHVLDYLRSC